MFAVVKSGGKQYRVREGQELVLDRVKGEVGDSVELPVGFTVDDEGFDATTLANLGFLPEHETDFIFSNLAERVGFVGSMLLILLFFVLIWRILHVATISRDRFGVLIAVGIGTMFLFHVLVNIGMTMGIMPVTGIPLPFISYGRSSLVVSVMSLGLLQSIAMRSRSEASKTPKV